MASPALALEEPNRAAPFFLKVRKAVAEENLEFPKYSTIEDTMVQKGTRCFFIVCKDTAPGSCAAPSVAGVVTATKLEEDDFSCEIFVRPPFRGRGIAGRALTALQVLLGREAAGGRASLRLDVQRGNRAGVRNLEKLGLAPYAATAYTLNGRRRDVLHFRLGD